MLNSFLETYYPKRLKALPLYVTRGDLLGAAGYSHNGGILTLYRTNPDWNTNSVHDYWYSQHLVHEIGHGLDLAHTYDNANQQNCHVNQFDFLWDVYDTTAIRPCPSVSYCDVCPILASSHNNIIMGGYAAQFMSALQMGIMHRATVLENQWNTGYNMRRYVTGYNENPLEIAEDQTWDFSIKMYQDLVIKSGATLTIQCDVKFVPQAKVVIEPGGTLIIDGGTLTNEAYYNDYWQGIQVYGTTNKSQFPESNPTYQGKLIVENGGIIENAVKAVTNWHQDKWGEIGGVIQVNDGVFRNNRRDVEFMSYQNFVPNNPNNKLSDFSYFRNTDFISDDNFIEKGLPAQKHVTLWEVHGINFLNCHFSNNVTGDKSITGAPNGGIYAIDASFTVGPQCTGTIYPCPASNLLKSSFTGLEIAIEASGSGTSETATISQTDFTDNIWGVKVDEFDNVSINRNNIEIGDGGYTLFWPIGVGIYLDNSTGYIVEENNVSTSLTNGYYNGVVADNSSGDNNRLYKNTFTGLTIGTEAVGVNHNTNYQEGLQF